MVKQDKHNLKLLMIKLQWNTDKTKCHGTEKKNAKEYVILGLRVTVIHLALPIGFAISGLVIKSYRV